MNLVLYISPKCGQGGGSKNPKILRTSYMDGPKQQDGKGQLSSGAPLYVTVL